MKKIRVLSSLCLVIQLFPVAVYGFVQADLESLLSTNECIRCDLSGADLSGKTLTKAKLDGANLTGADLTNTILRMADLQEVNFRNANLTFTVFEAADLYKANFDGANLEGTVFDGAYLVETIFGGETLVRDTSKEVLTKDPASGDIAVVKDTIKEQQVSKKIADGPRQGQNIASTEPMLTVLDVEALPALKSRDMGQSVKSLTQVPQGLGGDPSRYAPNPILNITGFKPLEAEPAVEEDSVNPNSPMSKDDLLDQVGDTQMCVGCDFSGMDLADKKFKGIYLEGGKFEGANLEGANLQSANLKGANLRNANLRGADLRNADLYKADLSGADLSGADLKDTLVAGANLAGANLQGTVLSQEPVAQ